MQNGPLLLQRSRIVSGVDGNGKCSSLLPIRERTENSSRTVLHMEVLFVSIYASRAFAKAKAGPDEWTDMTVIAAQIERRGPMCRIVVRLGRRRTRTRPDRWRRVEVVPSPGRLRRTVRMSLQTGFKWRGPEENDMMALPASPTYSLLCVVFRAQHHRSRLLVDQAWCSAERIDARPRMRTETQRAHETLE